MKVDNARLAAIVEKMFCMCQSTQNSVIHIQVSFSLIKISITILTFILKILRQDMNLEI